MGGIPTLPLSVNRTGAVATYESGSGTNVLNFSYTVQANDSSQDLAYTSTKTINLNGATMKGITTVDAMRTLPTVGSTGSLNANKDIKIDGLTIFASGLSLTPKSMALEAGSPTNAEGKLTATLSPSNATNKSIIWESSKPAVATVDQSGKVTAVAAGTTTIKATSGDGKASDTATVTVTDYDNQGPVITLIGNNPMNISVNSVYSEPGANVTDLVEGDLTHHLKISGSVDSSKVGSYSITYMASDSKGNAATPVTRVVNVVDDAKPIITLKGTSPITIPANATYTDAGATASDAVDGDLTAQIITVNSVDTTKPGTYTVTYNVTDKAGNAAKEVTRTVIVTDQSKPVLTLTGGDKQTVPANQPYVDPGFAATDAVDGDLTKQVTVTGTVDVTKPGAYDLTYTITDAAGNTTTLIRTVTVVDDAKPIITLKGTSPITVPANAAYTDAGATASDAVDGDLTAQIITVNAVDTTKPGTYTVTYNVTDKAGNAAVEVTRTVVVTDQSKPVLTLTGGDKQTVPANQPYVDPGFAATDAVDGDLTKQVTVTGIVDVTKPGTYDLTYTITDAAGNTTTLIRTVTVVDDAKPIITLKGTSPLTVPANVAYTDSGATASDAVDGDLTAQIITVNAVDTTKPGTYTVTYNVTDKAGNAAKEVTRTVIVTDQSKPVLTLNGGDKQTVPANQPYVDPGFTATDAVDGDLTKQVTVTGTVDVTKPGTYDLTYTITDAAGNTTTLIRTVTVVDDAKPIITLKGTSPLTVPANADYTDAGATASDAVDGDLTAQIITVNAVDTTKPGTYTVTYNVTDKAGNAATEVTRTVIVTDQSKPVLTLTDGVKQTVPANQPYVDPGFAATDAVDGDLTKQVTVTGTVDVTKPGTYDLTYTITDAAGNTTTLIRTVTVVDDAKPIITLKGTSPITIPANAVYTDAGATASDAVDGDLTAQIITVNAVDTTKPGTYTVTYNVTDKAGNAAVEVTRTVVVTDQSKPVLSLTGGDKQTVPANQPYVDPGFAATDAVDGDLTKQVTVTGTVDVTKPGTYDLTYTITDAAGNTATLIRTVTVVDDAKPIITLKGTSPITVPANATYTDAGATASDVVDGDLTAQIVTTQNVDTTKPGAYTVTYNVTDKAGNAAVEVTRTVVVTDQSKPVLTLTGGDKQTVPANQPYVDPGFAATDAVDGDLTKQVTVTGTVDVTKPGAYDLTYTITDAAGNTTTLIRTVTVVDDAKPIITLKGTSPITIPANATYTDAGATASDAVDGDLTAQIITVNAVDTAKPGTYTVTYNVTDKAGNAATEVTRTVIVTDQSKPVLTLTGGDKQTVPANQPYVDPGFAATDAVDGDLTKQVTVTGTVDVTKPGAYDLTYTITDAAGNTTTLIRTVTVVDDAKPVITLKGTSPLTVPANAAYTDAGATASDAVDGDLTAQIITVNAVDTTKPGTYTVTYNVTDKAGNAAVEVTRTVVVVDDAKPVITRIGSAVVKLTAGESYTDLGATAYDAVDGNLTNQIATVNSVATDRAGTYIVTYNVKDTAGNQAIEVIRTVNVHPKAVSLTADVTTLYVSGAEPGAVIRITDKNGKTTEVIADSDGKAQLEVDKTLEGPFKAVQEIQHLTSDPSQAAALQTSTKLQGTVYDVKTNKPIAGVSVSLTDLKGQAVNQIVHGQTVGKYKAVLTDSNGHYEFSELVPNKYQVSGELTPYAISNDVADVSQKDGTLDIYLTKLQLQVAADPQTIVGDGISTSTIKTTVLDEAGAPMANIQVELQAMTGSFINGQNTASSAAISGKTDMKGIYEAVFQSSKIKGVHSVSVPIKAKVTLENGMVAYRTIFMTFEPASINGVFKDNAGNPISGAVVQVAKDFDGDGITDFYSETTTDKDGRYKIAVPEGQTDYPLQITKTEVVDGQTESVTFKQIATIKGSIKGTGGENFPSTNTYTGIVKASAEGMEKPIKLANAASSFTIADPRGVLATAKVDEKGLFVLEGLQKGQSYKMDILYTFPSGEQIKVGEMTAEVSEDGELRVGEALVDPYGTITDAVSGKVIPGVEVKIYYADTARNQDGVGGIYAANTLSNFGIIKGFAPADNANPQVSDSNGFYAWMVQPDTDYYIVATKAGYESYRSNVISVYKAIVRHDFTMKQRESKTPVVPTPTVPEVPAAKQTAGNKPVVPAQIPNNGAAVIGNSGEKGSVYTVKPGTGTHGDVLLTPDGTFTFIPDRGFTGMETVVIVETTAAKKTSENTFTIYVNEPAAFDQDKRSLTVETTADQLAYDSNEPIQVTLTYSNPLGRKATAVELTAFLPEFIEIVSAGTGKAGQNKLVWEIAELAAGQKSTVTFTVKRMNQTAKIERIEFVGAIKENQEIGFARTAVSKLGVLVKPFNAKLVQLSYISGYPDGGVDADTGITRAEIATMLIRATQSSKSETQGNLFKDVKKGSWYGTYVEAAQKAGLVVGGQDGNYRPQGKMTRAELAMVLANYFDMNSLERTWSQDAFKDIKGHWAQNDINAVYRYKLISGYADGTFKPDQKVTRLEAVIMINNLLEREALSKVSPSFNDLNQSHWGFGEIEAAFRGYTETIVNGKATMSIN